MDDDGGILGTAIQNLAQTHPHRVSSTIPGRYDRSAALSMARSKSAAKSADITRFRNTFGTRPIINIKPSWQVQRSSQHFRVTPKAILVYWRAPYCWTSGWGSGYLLFGTPECLFRKTPMPSKPDLLLWTQQYKTNSFHTFYKHFYIYIPCYHSGCSLSLQSKAHENHDFRISRFWSVQETLLTKATRTVPNGPVFERQNLRSVLQRGLYSLPATALPGTPS